MIKVIVEFGSGARAKDFLGGILGHFSPAMQIQFVGDLLAENLGTPVDQHQLFELDRLAVISGSMQQIPASSHRIKSKPGSLE